MRLLNLRTSDGNLLKSSVLMTGGGGLGVIEEAYAPAGGGPIIAALAAAPGRAAAALTRSCQDNNDVVRYRWSYLRRGERSPTSQRWPKGSMKPPWRWTPQGAW